MFLSKASNEKGREKITRALMKIEGDQAITERWMRDSADFKAGLELLRARKINRWA
jgi:phosphoserine phosphatase